MHDGYLFTLGICGSAGDDDPATELLNDLLAALPPVKRAAFLASSPTDQAAELVAAVVADMRDAELMVIVTPANAPHLPPCLEQILAAARAVDVRGRYAALYAIGPYADAASRALRAAVADCGLVIAAAHHASADQPPSPSTVYPVYLAARAALAPNALPPLENKSVV